MKSAVIYARYSSDSQTEQSIEGQIRVCKQYAEANDMLIVDTYIDRAMTGTNDNRAAFQKMLKDSNKKQWQIILVYKLDRFSRNKYESVIHKKTLKDNGVKLVSAMENIPDSPEGGLMESLLEGFNQYYSEELTQKINRGLRESWLKGNATGGNNLFGYNVVNKKYIIKEDEATIVNEVFTRYANGENAKTIADSLINRGITYRNGKKFNDKMVYYIIHNKRYTGVVEHKGETYYDIFPRIISDELWQKVESITEKNKISPSRKLDMYNFILTSKLVCGKCHKLMSGSSGTSKTKNVYYYYVCQCKKRGRICDTKPIRKEFIEDIVINNIVTLFKDRTLIHEVALKIYNMHQKETQDNTALKYLQKQREEAVKSTNNVMKAIEQGIITDTTKQRLVELETKIAELDFEISKEKIRTYTYITIEEIEYFLNDNLCNNTDDIDVRKILVNTFIREVILYEDKVVITYNFIDPHTTHKITRDGINKIEEEMDDDSLISSGELSSSPPKHIRRTVLRFVFFILRFYKNLVIVLSYLS